MADLTDKMFSFISLAVCHCGYLFGKSKLTSGGLWLIRKWSKSGCLDQLSLMDNSDPRKTFMYKLSKKKGLEYFRKILLVSSQEDKYTPYNSARIELSPSIEKEPKWGNVYQ